MSELPYVELYTDGACSPNPGIGGWGTLLVSPAHNNHTKKMSGAERTTTNNRMELQAVIEGLKALSKPCKVRITTDSQYICNAFGKGWLKNWKKNNWRTKSKKAVKNKDQWVELVALTEKHEVSWQWVRGHDGHPMNEQADELAVKARENLRDGVST